MSELKSYAIFDKKASAWMSPFQAHTHGVAERTVQDLLRRGEGTIANYPQDFELWQVGLFNDKTGEQRGIEHVFIGLVSDLGEKPEEPALFSAGGTA